MPRNVERFTVTHFLQVLSISKPSTLHFPLHTSWYNCYKLDQPVHTLCFNLQHSYMFRASPVHQQGEQMYETVASPYYHLQYIEMCWDHQRTIHRGEYVHWNCTILIYKYLNYKHPSTRLYLYRACSKISQF